MTLRFVSFSRVLVTLTLLSSLFGVGCDGVYRHESENGITEATHTEAMGGWIRYDGYGNVIGDLDVAWGEYANEDGIVVRLVGAIHIGDRGYYRELQRLLEETDIVLYEGINRSDAPKGTVDPSTMKMWNAISGLIGLRAQVADIDYKRASWRQVDSIVEVDESEMEEMDRIDEMEEIPEIEIEEILEGDVVIGDDIEVDELEAQDWFGGDIEFDMDQFFDALTLISQAKDTFGYMFEAKRVEDSVKHQYAMSLVAESDGSMEQSFEELADSLEQVRMMLKMASQFFEIEGIDEIDMALAAMQENLAEFARVIITERNKHVFDELLAEISRLDEPTSISIFYGAAHMPDFEERLKAAGFKFKNRDYVRAWAMNSPRDDRRVSRVSDGDELVGSTLADPPASVKFHGERADGLTLIRWWTHESAPCEASLPSLEQWRLRYRKAGLNTLAVFHPSWEGVAVPDNVAELAADAGYRGSLAVDGAWDWLKATWLTQPRTSSCITLLVDANQRILAVESSPAVFPSSDPSDTAANDAFMSLDNAIRRALRPGR